MAGASMPRWWLWLWAAGRHQHGSLACQSQFTCAFGKPKALAKTEFTTPK
jgi:hypothetical protein